MERPLTVGLAVGLLAPIKGAIVGGVAGSVAGHGKVGREGTLAGQQPRVLAPPDPRAYMFRP